MKLIAEAGGIVTVQCEYEVQNDEEISVSNYFKKLTEEYVLVPRAKLAELQGAAP